MSGVIETDSKGRFTRITGDDDPWKLSQRTRVSFQMIQRLNPGVDFKHVKEGFKVYISVGENETDSERDGDVETDSLGDFVRIRGNDNPWKISQRMNVNYDVVLALNPGAELIELEEGFKLYIWSSEERRVPTASGGKLILIDSRR